MSTKKRKVFLNLEQRVAGVKLLDQGKSAVPRVATVMAELCGWDEQRKEKEIQLFHQHIKEIYQVQKYRGDSVCD